MRSRTISNTALRDPKPGERPKFSPEVPIPIRAHIWIRWLRNSANSRRAKGSVYISCDGAVELADLLEAVATEQAP